MLRIVDSREQYEYEGELALLAAAGRTHLQTAAGVQIAAAAGVVVMPGPVAAAAVPPEALVENREWPMVAGLLKSGMELVYGG